jgi:hypothetical protein
VKHYLPIDASAADVAAVCTGAATIFRFTGARLAVSEDGSEPIASFTRAIAAFACRSASRIWDTLDEYRSVTSEIHASMLASRFTALFAHNHSSQSRLALARRQSPKRWPRLSQRERR